MNLVQVRQSLVNCFRIEYPAALLNHNFKSKKKKQQQQRNETSRSSRDVVIFFRFAKGFSSFV